MSAVRAAARDLTVSPALAEIAKLIVNKTGLASYVERDERLSSKINARIRKLGIKDYANYLTLLSDPNDSGEWDELISEISIGETSFFRYPSQMDALRDIVLPDCLAQRDASDIRIWSAGCASGAEPYSIALLLQMDLVHLSRGARITILGTDICKSRLRQAESGLYSEWEMRAIPDRYRRACFVSKGRDWAIRDEYKSLTEFRSLNLVEDIAEFAARHAAEFDVILCRNVMIYFSAEQNRRLLKSLHGCVREGGWFITGHSEPYLEISHVFRPQPVAGAMLYRKQRKPGGQSDTALVEAEVRRRAQKTGLNPRLPEIGSPIAIQQAKPAAAQPAPAKQNAPNPTNDIDEVRRLANAGAWREALNACARLCASDPFDPRAHFIMGLLHEHSGEHETAEAALRRAIYLDANFALAHYHVAMSSVARADATAAVRSIQNVFKSLKSTSDSACVLSGDGLTAGELRELAEMQLRSLESRQL